MIATGCLFLFSNFLIRFSQLLGEFGYRVSFSHLCFYENWEDQGMQLKGSLSSESATELTRGWSLQGGVITDNVCARGRSKGRPNVLFSGPNQR